MPVTGYRAGPPAPHGHPYLTPRELEVLARIQLGLTNAAIGRALGVTDVTVKVHVRSMFKKYNVTSRLQLMIVTKFNGLDLAHD